MSDTPPAGWYPDPQDDTRQRYWDGNAWTEHTAEGGPQGQAAAVAGSTTSAAGDPDTWTWQSILATIFCCNFLGIAGVLNAGRAEAALRAGDLAGAREHARKARMWTLWAGGLGVLIIGGIIVFFIAVGAGIGSMATSLGIDCAEAEPGTFDYEFCTGLCAEDVSGTPLEDDCEAFQG